MIRFYRIKVILKRDRSLTRTMTTTRRDILRITNLFVEFNTEIANLQMHMRHKLFNVKTICHIFCFVLLAICF